MQTFKVLGLLLTYPEGTVLGAAPELMGVLRSEALLPDPAVRRVEEFLTAQCGQELLAAQEEYVDTFDRGRAHCLHLFEHIHGESRDRGQALVNLSETYAAKGLYIDGNELPDYLPLFMEYLSRCPFEEAAALLGEAIDVIAMIGVKLKRRESPYAAVFEAIEALSAVKPDQVRIKDALGAEPQDPKTLDELDEQWREAEAFSGDPSVSGGADCGSCNAFPNATRQLNRMVEGA